MERGIKLLIGFQGQWRAGRKDPQASWTLECEGQTPSRSEGAPPVRTKMDYSDSQVSSSEWFYPHPDYPVDSYMRSRLNRAFYSTFQTIILTSTPSQNVNNSR